MTLDQVQLYTQVYKGNKTAFNSTKQVGKLIQGIAVDIDKSQDIVILRDKENFPHCVSILTLKKVEK